MSTHMRTVLAVWRGRRDRSLADASYTVYLVIMIALVTIAPLVRGVWLVATDAALAAAVAPTTAAPIAGVVVASVWVVALIAGHVRGPVVFEPFLAHVLTGGAIPQRTAFARTVWITVGVSSAVGATVAGCLSLAWNAAGALTGVGGSAAVLAGAACGGIAAVLWLVGQCAGDRALAVSVGMVTMSLAAAVTLPSSWPFSPVGWVMATYAQAGDPWPALALTGMAALGLALTPRLTALLNPATVARQSRQWAGVRLHAGTLDFSASASTYQPLPRRGRSKFAVRGAPSFALLVLVRDALAAVRTPARLATSIIGLVCCGALIALAATAVPTAWMLSAAAGLAAYAAVGAVSDGIRHAIEAAAALPLYGTSDLAMLAAHALFPILVTILAVTIGAIGFSVLAPTATWTALAAALALAVSAVAIRVMNALKPPLPLALLVPIPTPAGDAAALNRVLWAADGLIFAAAAGLAAAIVASAILPVAGLVFAVITVSAYRWKRR